MRRLSIVNGYCLGQYYCLRQGSEQLKKKHRDSRKMKMNMKGYALIAAIGVTCTPAAAAGRSSEGPRPVGPRRERSERKKRRRK